MCILKSEVNRKLYNVLPKLSCLKTFKNFFPCEIHCRNTDISMTFNVLFTSSSWLAAFSCFSLWLLEGSDLLSLHSQSKDLFSALSNCLRTDFHPSFYQKIEPWISLGLGQQQISNISNRCSLVGDTYHSSCPHPSTQWKGDCRKLHWHTTTAC